jgi:hypothetical protein
MPSELLLPRRSYLESSANNFWHSESQYKYRFKGWDWKRNIPASKKQKINEYRQSRAQLGKSTTVSYKGRPVDDRQLRRQAKKATRVEMTLAAPETPAFLINISGSRNLIGGRMSVNLDAYIEGHCLTDVAFLIGTCPMGPCLRLAALSTTYHHLDSLCLRQVMSQHILQEGMLHRRLHSPRN